MALSMLIDGLPVRGVHGASEGVMVGGVVEDSRQVTAGDLFVARMGGKSDGRAFAAQAVAAGAVAVLTDEEGARTAIGSAGVVVLVVDDPARVGAVIAERLWGSPSSKLHLIGITGTNGKSTTAHLVQQLLAGAGLRCGLIGTVEVDEGDGPTPARMTTPSAVELSAMLAGMVANGCTACAMEVSSHGLDQGRTAGLGFDAGVFTNLSGDHLDYHRTLEAYADAKARLFEGLGADAQAIVNADDAASARMLRDCSARRVLCGRTADGDVRVERLEAPTLRGGRVRITGEGWTVEAHCPLIGDHNLENLMLAVVAAIGAGASEEAIQGGMPGLRPPRGRLERVEGGGDLEIFVDFAHTDDALRRTLAEVRGAMGDRGRLIAVFGCGGDRDTTKRPRMGRAVAEVVFGGGGDGLVIVTSDNPRSEDPEAIIGQVLGGIAEPVGERVIAEADRRRAIGLAVSRARGGDVIVIAGKGHEREQIVRGEGGGLVRLPFDDHEVARGALEALQGGVGS